MGDDEPYVMTGRYAVVSFGALPGAIVMMDSLPGSNAHVSELRITFEDGADVVSMLGPVQLHPTWEAGIEAAEKIAREQRS